MWKRIVNESIEDVEESQAERDIVRTSERNEQIGDDSDETINNVAVNVETLDEETQLIIAQLNKILAGGRNTDGISFKKVDMNTLNRTTAKVNRVIELIETKNITQTNNLIKAAAIWVADQLGLKKHEGGKKKDPWWKRRIEEDIKQLKKDIEKVKKGRIGARKEGKAKPVEEKYGVKKGITTVIEELKKGYLQKLLKYLNTDKGSNSTRLIDSSKWIKSKFTTSSMYRQGVVTETYLLLKKVGHFGVDYGV